MLIALLIEQLRPLPQDNAAHSMLGGWVAWVGRNFDAGDESHARVVWAVSVVLPALVCVIAYRLLLHYSVLAALVWNVALLYVTVGFRQFSHHYTKIRTALENGDELEARTLLAQWRHLDTSDLPRTELLRHVIEHSILAAHRHVFGAFFWFVVIGGLGLGPLGALVYRLAEFSSRYWAYKSRITGEPTNLSLMQWSQRAFDWIDYLPARLTAIGFAIVGDFEGAIDSWRRWAHLWSRHNEGLILASAAGALGLSLGGHAAPALTLDRSKTLTEGDQADVNSAAGSTPGAEPQLRHLQNVVGLIWRSMVLWMLLLALLSLANLVG